ANLALEGAFSFGPGAQVTCVPEVKGLEFDHVVVPDAAAGQYADTAEARRSLYVAATRASSQLVLAAAGMPSPLLRSELPVAVSAVAVSPESARARAISSASTCTVSRICCS